MSYPFALKPAVIAISLLGAAISSHAQIQETRSYAIEAGPLSDNLARIARESGRSISAAPSLLQGKQSAAIKGNYTVEEAIGHALQGSGLELTVTSGGTFTVRPVSASGTSDAATLPSITVSSATSPYLADRPSSVATKSSLPPRMTPFSVNQASEELIVERGDQNIYDVIERFSGVTANNGQSDIGINMDRNLSVRGFANASSNDGQILINGQRAYGAGGGMRGTDSLESVELLRGPASLYYGAAQPGGVFNYNYKRPKAEAAYVLRGRTDSEGSIGGMIDMTGPLNADKTLRYRFVGSYTKQEDDQRHVWSKPNSTLAALQWAPNSQFETTLTYENLDIKVVPEKENNKKTRNGEYYPIAQSDSFLGQLSDRAENKVDTFIWDATWKPSEDFKINANLNYQKSFQWYAVTRPSGSGGGGTPPDPSATGDIPRSASFSPGSQRENLSAGIDFSGKFMTGKVKHEWLFGGGMGESRSRSKSRRTTSGEFDSGNYIGRNGNLVPPGMYAPDPLNIHDLNNGYWQWLDVVMAQSDYMVPWAKRKDMNLYFQDMLHLPDGRTRIMAAIGWAKYDSLARGSYNFNTGLRGRDTQFDTDKVTPRLAIMHDVTDMATIYASYGKSFAPQPSLTRLDSSGEALLSPEEGVQYEIGYKQDLNGINGLFTASLFRLDKKNIARSANELCDSSVTDPMDPNYCYYELDGLQRSQGIELSLSGEITRGWQSAINYTYLDTEIVETENEYQRGRSFSGIPRHSASIWNKFLVMNNQANGELWLGVGIRGQSSMHTAYSATGAETIPGYGVVDLGLFWKNKIAGRDLRINLNLNNAFDRTLYVGTSARPTGTLIYGPERRLLLTAQMSF